MPLMKHDSTAGRIHEEPRHVHTGMDLVALMDDPDPAARRSAARDLVHFPESVSVLIAHLTTEREPSVREMILTTLVRWNDPAAVACLVNLLRSDVPTLRNEAVETLKEFPDHISGFIHELLTDSSPDVRIFGVNVLEPLRHPDVEQWLIELIESDSDVNVCATAVELLAKIGTERSREPLEALTWRFRDVIYLAFAIDLARRRIDQA